MEKELELLTTSLHEFPQPRTTDTSIRSAKCAHDAKDRAGSMRRTTARVYRMPNSAFRRLGNIFKDPAPIHAEIYSVLRGTAITTLVFNRSFLAGRSKGFFTEKAIIALSSLQERSTRVAILWKLVNSDGDGSFINVKTQKIEQA